eukprot:364253-Chlamydomonas_euryale.AAC.10
MGYPRPSVGVSMACPQIIGGYAATSSQLLQPPFVVGAPTSCSAGHAGVSISSACFTFAPSVVAQIHAPCVAPRMWPGALPAMCLTPPDTLEDLSCKQQAPEAPMVATLSTTGMPMNLAQLRHPMGIHF